MLITDNNRQVILRHHENHYLHHHHHHHQCKHYAEHVADPGQNLSVRCDVLPKPFTGSYNSVW